MEMYRAPQGQTTLVQSPARVLVQPAQKHTTGPVFRGCRGEDKPDFDNASLIDSDSFQVSCRFPDLFSHYSGIDVIN